MTDPQGSRGAWVQGEIWAESLSLSDIAVDCAGG